MTLGDHLHVVIVADALFDGSAGMLLANGRVQSILGTFNNRKIFVGHH